MWLIKKTKIVYTLHMLVKNCPENSNKTSKSLKSSKSLKHKRTFFNLMMFLILYLTIAPLIQLELPKLVLAGIQNVYATSPSITIDINDDLVKPGHIISLNNDSYTLSLEEYSTKVFGVVIETPKVAYEDKNIKNPMQVATSGEVEVLVSGLNGSVYKGDFITTSKISGVGQKASRPGSVIGRALENYVPSDKYETRKILVTLDIKEVSIPIQTSENVLGLLQQSIKGPYLSPLTSLRYVLSAFLVAVTFVMGLIYFGKLTVKSIESLGRNPMASEMLTREMLLHFFLIGLVFVGTIIIAYFILIL